MEVVEGVPIQVIPGTKRKSLQAIARRARYEVDLSALTDAERSEMRRTIDAFTKSESCVVERTFWTPQSSREIVDWESPFDPLAKTPSDSAQANNGSANARPARTVDLRKAIVEIALEPGPPRMELELFLSRDDGQIANPRVVLERLFRLAPEKQARLRVVRTELLTESGTPIVSSLTHASVTLASSESR
jgi:hypothetical protein